MMRLTRKGRPLLRHTCLGNLLFLHKFKEIVMRNRFILSAALLLAALPLWGQLPRSAEFHEKYRLDEVVIFSRHNVRAPLTGKGSSLDSLTDHKWIEWTAPKSELTLGGGALETLNGQFFRQWVCSEGLLPHNARPSADEVLFYANSKQRTIATSRYFLAGFLPVSAIGVTWEGEFDKMNPMFDLSFHGITKKFRRQIDSELTRIYGKDGLRRLSESLEPNYRLLAEVLDSRNSFSNHDLHLVLEEGDEPRADASLNDALQAADALLLQYYEQPDSLAATFGHPLSRQQWRDIVRIKDECDHLRFAAPCLYEPLAAKIFRFISSELRNESRRFTFICGHDTNIVCMLNALGVKHYEAPGAIEIHTPIGSKIVFEKWLGADGKRYIALNHVYQRVDQLRYRKQLTLDNPPMVLSLALESLEANADGLYPYEEFMALLDRICAK